MKHQTKHRHKNRQMGTYRSRNRFEKTETDLNAVLSLKEVTFSAQSKKNTNRNRYELKETERNRQK